MEYTLYLTQKEEQKERLLALKERYKANIAFDVDAWIERNSELIRHALVVSETSECEESDALTLSLLEHMGRGMDLLCEKFNVSSQSRLMETKPQLKKTFQRFFSLCVGDGACADASLSEQGVAHGVSIIDFELFKELNNKEAIGSSKWKLVDYAPNKKTKTFDWFQFEMRRKHGSRCTQDILKMRDMWDTYRADIKERAERKGRFLKKSDFLKQNIDFLRSKTLDPDEAWNGYNCSWKLLLGFKTGDAKSGKSGSGQKRKLGVAKCDLHESDADGYM